jgi:hypothetical protein
MQNNSLFKTEVFTINEYHYNRYKYHAKVLVHAGTATRNFVMLTCGTFSKEQGMYAACVNGL